jgi:hypothetical protein
MTIDEIYRITQFFYNKEQNGNIAPEQFNLVAPRAQISFINGRITPKYDAKGIKTGWQSDQTIRRELSNILKLNESITVSGGIAVPPGEYIDWDSLTTNGGILIQEATPDEIAIMNRSVIAPPTATFPKFVVSEAGFHIYPTSLTPIKLNYLRQPETPIWNYTMVSGKPIYAATGGVVGAGNSVDFELADITHLEIIMIILQFFGVNLSLAELTQYAMIKEKEGV